MTKQYKNPSDDDTPSLMFWCMLLELRYRYMTREELLRLGSHRYQMSSFAITLKLIERTNGKLNE